MATEIKKKYYDTKLDKFVLIVIYIINILISISVILPLMHVLACSFSSASDILAAKVTIFPSSFTLTSYQAVFGFQDLMRGFANSIFYASLGSVISVAMTVALAYPLSKGDLPGRMLIQRVMMITMLFNGGMIPTYMVSRTFHLTNDRWGFLFLTWALTVYSVFVARTFFKSSIDQAIYDSAEIDGAGVIRSLISIVLPLSKAVIAVLFLWAVVARWNDYMTALIYLTDEELQPMQMVVRQIMEMTSTDPSMITDYREYEEMRNLQVTLKYATIVVSSIPLLIVYPFVQKHFVKGVMLGSVKG